MPKFVTVTANPAVDRSFTVPGFLAGEVNRAEQVRTTPGGKGVNAARVLRTLGADVAAIGFAGGSTGQMLRTGIATEKIAADFVDISPLETRLAIVIVDPAARSQTVVNEPGPELTEDHLEALEKLLIASVDLGGFVLFCGSLPPGIPSDAYARLIEAAHRVGAKTMIDSSGRALSESFRAHPTVVKINRKELKELGILIQDWNRDAFAVVQEFRGLCGAQIVAITDGGNGAFLAAGELGFYRVSPPMLETVSAVGSGDSFAAGLAFGLHKSPEDIEGALRLAAACGGANALNEGPGYMTAEQIAGVSGKIVCIKMA